MWDAVPPSHLPDFSDAIATKESRQTHRHIPACKDSVEKGAARPASEGSRGLPKAGMAIP